MMGYPRVSPDLTEDAVVGLRAAAFFLDVALVTLAAGVLAVALSVEGWSTGPTALFWLVAWFGYVVVSQGRYGQTLGKRLVGVVVTTTEGGPCGYRAALVRELVRLGDLLSLGVVGSLVRVGSRRQRLGDLAAGTVVVPANREARRL
ncbi:RDD family protein [Halomarina rubra]|uniref:RDD family protein n=1 Tax=Halomarina rubra TaxID=2071873 RepID=A0ABD6AWH8_9EURY|nr:RDD family protein [Halomarina rubra]